MRSGSSTSRCRSRRAGSGSCSGDPMKPSAFRYERPESVEEAAAVLAEHGDEAKVLAGGQSLVPVLNFRLLRPSVLVDVNRVAGLDTLAGGRVGATVRQRDFRGNALVDQ